MTEWLLSTAVSAAAKAATSSEPRNVLDEAERILAAAGGVLQLGGKVTVGQARCQLAVRGRKDLAGHLTKVCHGGTTLAHPPPSDLEAQIVSALSVPVETVVFEGLPVAASEAVRPFTADLDELQAPAPPHVDPEVEAVLEELAPAVAATSGAERWRP